MAVNVARTDAPKVAAMATRAKPPGEMCAPGRTLSAPTPSSVPTEPLISSSGASVPPDVPEPRAITQATNLATAKLATAPAASLAVRTSLMASYPTPSARGSASPTRAKPTAPMSGCQKGRTGRRR